MKIRKIGLWVAAFAPGFLAACSGHASLSWNPRTAAAYLDQRETWWASWPPAALAHGTFCVSCHTTMPYALARPALRDVLGQTDPTATERQLLEDIRRRERLWSSAGHNLTQSQTAARATEAVFFALILSSYDARDGHLSGETGDALREMWALQATSGADAGSWPWVNANDEPFEAHDSRYYGTTLAALAVGIAPDDYRSRNEIRSGVALLRGYLNREFAKQSPINHVALLWASAHLPGLIDASRRAAIIEDVERHQRPDGGWCLAGMVGPWTRRDGTPEVMKSDGYATGLVVLALEQSGLAPTNPSLLRGRAWLERNQSDWDGRWAGYSLNRRYARFLDPAARFMDDAATAFAVLALTEGRAGQTAPIRAVRADSHPSERNGSRG